MTNSIDELLELLQAPNEKKNKGLSGSSKEIWGRIGSKDTFDELGLSGSELDDFLKEWINENPYSNL
jgi:hypothetical protein